MAFPPVIGTESSLSGRESNSFSKLSTRLLIHRFPLVRIEPCQQEQSRTSTVKDSFTELIDLSRDRNRLFRHHRTGMPVAKAKHLGSHEVTLHPTAITIESLFRFCFKVLCLGFEGQHASRTSVRFLFSWFVGGHRFLIGRSGASSKTPTCIAVDGARIWRRIPPMQPGS